MDGWNFDGPSIDYINIFEGSNFKSLNFLASNSLPSCPSYVTPNGTTVDVRTSTNEGTGEVGITFSWSFDTPLTISGKYLIKSSN